MAVYHKSTLGFNLAHQQRVVDEVNELTDKLSNLSKFIDSPVFINLDSKEQNRLTRQLFVMELYWGILHERINNF